MKSIILITPWFGKFPKYFPLWLKSATYNCTIDFLIPTDSVPDGIEIPPNVRFLITSLEAIRNNLCVITGMDIVLKDPYKLCDYKPLYGLLYEKIVSQYDFWGYCDMDLVFGDLRHFLSEDILQVYDKIYSTGQLTVFRVCPETLNLFKTEVNLAEWTDFTYQEVFSTEYICHFDESAICKLADVAGLKTYRNCEYADVFAKYSSFVLCGIWDGYDIQFFEWERGTLRRQYFHDSFVDSMELAYVHLQKRKMKFYPECAIADSFSIIPNQFLPSIGIVTIEQMINFSKKKPNLFYYQKRIKSVFLKLRQGALSYHMILRERNNR